jgi:protein-tyrosine phosphatase
MATPRRILFVCLGNICRSQMAEAMLQHIVDERMLTHRFVIDSAGVGKWHVGKPPHRQTLSTLSRHGMTSLHVGRQVSAVDFEQFDDVIALDREVERDLLAMAPTPELASKVRLLRSYDPAAKGDLSVPDPYGRSDRDFEVVYGLIERSLLGLLDTATATS